MWKDLWHSVFPSPHLYSKLKIETLSFAFIQAIILLLLAWHWYLESEGPTSRSLPLSFTQKHYYWTANPWPAILCIHYAHLFTCQLPNHLIFCTWFFPNHIHRESQGSTERGSKERGRDILGEIMSLNQSDCVTVAARSHLPLAEPW